MADKTQTGIAIDPNLLVSDKGADLSGLKSFLSAYQDIKIFLTVAASVDEAAHLTELLENANILADYKIENRQIFMPRGNAVIADFLRRAGVRYYISSNDGFGRANGIEGITPLVLDSPGGCGIGVQGWAGAAKMISWLDSKGGVKRLTPMKKDPDNHTFRLETASETVVLKTYSGSEDAVNIDGEFNSLKALRDLGITCVPEPVEKAHHLATFKDVGGRAVHSPRRVDLKAMTDFLANLDNAADALRKKKLPNAPDARFTLDSYVDAVNNLWERVFSAAQSGNKDIFLFMMTDLEQMRQDNINHFILWCKRKTWDRKAELPAKEQIFSPVDFGLHNCLRLPDGTIAFLDWEKSGWDDPAHLMADFFHNTEQKLSTAAKLQVLNNFVAHRSGDPNFLNRFWAVADLVAVEWILHTLSVIRPSVKKRLLTLDPSLNYEKLVKTQFAKAQRMREEYVPMEHVCKHDQLLDANAKL